MHTHVEWNSKSLLGQIGGLGQCNVVSQYCEFLLLIRFKFLCTGLKYT